MVELAGTVEKRGLERYTEAFQKS